MKRVIAIIRMNMMNATKQALINAGFHSFNVRRVLGRGKGNVDFRVIHGAEAGAPEAIARLKDDGPMLIPKRMLSMVVPADQVPKLVETLIAANRTGNRGDGKIFVVPIDEAIRIRTGERGAIAVN